MATAHHPTDRLPPVAIELAELSKTGDLTKFSLGAFGQPGAATLAMLKGIGAGHDDQVKRFAAAGAVSTGFANQGAAIAATMAPTVDRYAAISAALAPSRMAQFGSVIASIQAEQKRNAATVASVLRTQGQLTEVGARTTAMFRAVPPLTEPVAIVPPTAPVDEELLAELIGLQERSLDGQLQFLEQQSALLEIQRQSAEAANRALWWVKAAVIAAVVVPLILRFV